MGKSTKLGKGGHGQEAIDEQGRYTSEGGGSLASEKKKAFDLMGISDNSVSPGKNKKTYDLSNDALGRLFTKHGGDENAVLDEIRASGKDYGMSNGDLQGVVEAFGASYGGAPQTGGNDTALQDGGTSLIEKELLSLRGGDRLETIRKNIEEKYISKDDITDALGKTNGDIEAAADLLTKEKLGVTAGVSSRLGALVSGMVSDAKEKPISDDNIKKLPKEAQDWIERNKEDQDVEFEAPKGDDTIWFKTTAKETGDVNQYSYNPRTGIKHHETRFANQETRFANQEKQKAFGLMGLDSNSQKKNN